MSKKSRAKQQKPPAPPKLVLPAEVKRAFEIGMIQVEQEAVWMWEWLLDFRRTLDERLQGGGHPLQGPAIMEIGTNQGGFLWMLCEALKPSLALSVDVVNGAFSSGNVIVSKRTEALKTCDCPSGFGVTWIEGSSFDPKVEARVKAALGKEKLDFLVIDGDHRFPDVDMAIYSPLVRPGGWIMFHDIADTPAHRDQKVQVPRFWKSVNGWKVELRAGAQFGGIGLLRVS
jgi:hypothetical protein